MDIDWPEDFGWWLDRLEGEARSGDERPRLNLTFTARALDQLRNLTTRRRRRRRPPRSAGCGNRAAISCGASRTRTRADPMIDQWKREAADEEKP